MDESVHSFLLKDIVTFRVLTTHAFNHGLVDSDWRHVDVFLGRLLTEDEAKI